MTTEEKKPTIALKRDPGQAAVITSEADFDAHMAKLMDRQEQDQFMAIVADPTGPVTRGNAADMRCTVQWLGDGPAPAGTIAVDDFITELNKRKTVEVQVVRLKWWQRLWLWVKKWLT